MSADDLEYIIQQSIGSQINLDRLEAPGELWSVTGPFFFADGTPYRVCLQKIEGGWMFTDHGQTLLVNTTRRRNQPPPEDLINKLESFGIEVEGLEKMRADVHQFEDDMVQDYVDELYDRLGIECLNRVLRLKFFNLDLVGVKLLHFLQAIAFTDGITS